MVRRPKPSSHRNYLLPAAKKQQAIIMAVMMIAVTKLILWALLTGAAMADWFRHRHVGSRGWELQRVLALILTIQTAAFVVLVVAAVDEPAAAAGMMGYVGCY